MSTKLDITPFIAPAQQLEKDKGVPTSITLGQLILESSSGGGLSKLATNAKNLFGIKAGSSWSGDTYKILTNEEVNGVMVAQEATFRKYSSYEDSIADYGSLITNSHYSEYTKNAGPTVYGYAQALQKAGYATDSKYADKLLQVISDNNLGQYSIDQYAHKDDPKPEPEAGVVELDIFGNPVSGAGAGAGSLINNIVTVVIIILVIGMMVLFFFNAFQMKGETQNA